MSLVRSSSIRRRLLAALAACGCGGLWAQSNPVSTLTISSNNTPMDKAGLQALSKAAFGRLGLAVRWINLPSERSLVAADAGEVDGEGLRVAGLEARYPHLVRVPESYLGVQFVAFAKDRRISLAQGWDSLKPYRVAHIKGWKLFESHAPKARVAYSVDQPEQLFRMLDAGRIDLALYTLTDGRALALALQMPDVVALTPALQAVDMYLYLHQRHADLVPRLAQALRDMKADASHARILADVARTAGL